MSDGWLAAGKPRKPSVAMAAISATFRYYLSPKSLSDELAKYGTLVQPFRTMKYIYISFNLLFFLLNMLTPKSLKVDLWYFLCIRLKNNIYPN